MSKLITEEEKFTRINEYTSDFIGVVEALDEKAKVLILVESPSGLSLMSGSKSMTASEIIGQMRLFTLRTEQQQIINYNKRVMIQEQINQQIKNNIATAALNKNSQKEN